MACVNCELNDVIKYIINKYNVSRDTAIDAYYKLKTAVKNKLICDTDICNRKILKTFIKNNRFYKFFNNISNCYLDLIIEDIDEICGDEDISEPELGFVFDDIEAGSPVVDPSDVSQWNTFFNLPDNGTPFTSVLVGAVVGGTEVLLFGGSNVTGANSLFNSNSNLLSVSDTGVIISLGVDFFNECTSVTSFNLQGLVTAGDYCFNSCISATTFNLPVLENAGDSCFGACVSATLFNIPLCASLGTTTGDDHVFTTISGNTITVNVPASLATADGGNPDGDLVYLAANNTATINYI
jgi:hypothetical protein